MAYETLKAGAGIVGVGLPGGYLASYFVQGLLFRLAVPFAVYVFRFYDILFLPLIGKESVVYSPLAAGTAWIGMAIGVGISLAGYLVIRAVTIKDDYSTSA